MDIQSLIQKIERVQNVALCLIRKWWRPITCVGICLTMFVHGVIVPLWNIFKHPETMTDLTGLSLLVTSVAAAFAVREWGKIKGTAE